MTAVEFDDVCYRRFIATVAALHPQKCFGYLLGSPDSPTVTDFYIFRGDLRATDAGREMFEPVGRYYRDHGDAGFLAPPEETLAFERERRARGLIALGMFHVHLRHPPYLAAIDRSLHADRRLWHLIVSLRTPSMPDPRVYVPDAGGHLQLGRIVVVSPAGGAAMVDLTWEQFLAEAMASGVDGPAGSLVAAALGRGIAVPSMLIRAAIDGGGPSGAEARRFAERGAESCLDRVRRGGLWWGATPVTVGQYQAVMRGIDVAAPAANLPMTQVDAHDAALFARLVGGRLPTLEEFRACVADAGTANPNQPEPDLADVAVFSENATSYPAPVASRKPGAHGMYDLQGLVWEWVENGSGWATVGGSRFAFAEMCAAEVAIPTHSDYRATDIGFRVCWDDQKC